MKIIVPLKIIPSDMQNLAPTLRLLSAAKKFNIGKDTLVEFLWSKGFECSSSPSAKLSPEMYSALLQEYGGPEEITYISYNTSEIAEQYEHYNITVKVHTSNFVCVMDSTAHLKALIGKFKNRTKSQKKHIDISEILEKLVLRYKTEEERIRLVQYVSKEYDKLANKSNKMLVRLLIYKANCFKGKKILKHIVINIKNSFRRIVQILFKNMDDSFDTFVFHLILKTNVSSSKSNICTPQISMNL